MGLSSGNVSGNVGKYKFLIGNDVVNLFLPEKGLLEQSPWIKRFEYSPLGSELKKQSSIVKHQYIF